MISPCGWLISPKRKSRISRPAVVRFEEASYIMEHVPVITDDSPDLLQMVVRDKDEYILYLKEDMDEFFEKHSADGWSSRGDADDILEETQEILDALVPKQNTLSAVI